MTTPHQDDLSPIPFPKLSPGIALDGSAIMRRFAFLPDQVEENEAITDATTQLAVQVHEHFEKLMYTPVSEDSDTQAQVRTAVLAAVAMNASAFNVPFEPEDASQRALEALFDCDRLVGAICAHALTHRADTTLSSHALELLATHAPKIAATRAVDLVDHDDISVRISALRVLAEVDAVRAQREIVRILSDRQEVPHLQEVARECLSLMQEDNSFSNLQSTITVADNVLGASSLLLAWNSQYPEKFAGISTEERLLALRTLERNLPIAQVDGRLAAIKLAIMSGGTTDVAVVSRCHSAVDIFEQKDSYEEQETVQRNVWGVQLMAAAAPGADRSVVHGQYSQEQVTQFHTALAEGQLPQQIVEDLRIVDPQSNEGHRFQQEMVKLVKLALGDKAPADLESYRFFLSDTGHPNLAYLGGKDARAYLITRGAIIGQDGREPLLETVADLVYLFKHEDIHRGSRAKLGDAFPNTKGEEATAYAKPLWLLDELGFNPELGLKTFRKAAHRERGSRELSHDLLEDPHPLDENTLSSMEVSLAHIRGRQQQGKQFRENPALSEFSDLKEWVGKTHHHSFLDKSYAEAGIDSSSSVPTRVEHLGKILSSIGKEGTAVQLQDIYDELERLAAKRPVPQNLAAFKALGITMLEATTLPIHLRTFFYTFAASTYAQREGVPALGRLKAINDASLEFVVSVSRFGKGKIKREIVAQAAAKLVTAVKDEPLYKDPGSRQLLHAVSWPMFQMPRLDNLPFDENIHQYRQEFKQEVADQKPITPSWAPLRTLVQQDTSIAEAALLLGLGNDPLVQKGLSQYPALVLPYHPKRSRRGEETESNATISKGPSASPPERRVRHIVVGDAEKPQVRIQELIFNKAGDIVGAIQPDLTSSHHSPLLPEGMELGHNLLEQQRRENLALWAEAEFAASTETPSKQLAVLLEYLQTHRIDVVHSSFHDDTPQVDDGRLVGLNHLTITNLPLFVAINQRALTQLTSATQLLEHFKKLLEEQRADAKQLIRAYFGLAQGKGSGLGEILDLSTRLSHEDSRRDRQAIIQGIASTTELKEPTRIWNNPYLVFIRDNPAEIFSTDERTSILGVLARDLVRESPGVAGSSTLVRDGFIDFIRPIIESTPFALIPGSSLQQLVPLLEKPIHVDLAEAKYTQAKTLNYPIRQINHASLESFLIKMRILTLAEGSAEEGAPTLVPLADILNYCAVELKQQSLYNIPSELAGHVTAQLTSGFSEIAHELIQQWALLTKSRLLEIPTAVQLRSRILRAIEGQTDLSQRLHLASTALRTEMFPDVEERQQLIGLWTGSFLALHGKDDETEGYANKFFRELQNIAIDEDNIGPRKESLKNRALERELLIDAARTLCAQPSLATRMKNYAERISMHDAMLVTGMGIAFDGMLEGVRSDSKKAQTILDFVSARETDESNHAVRVALGLPFTTKWKLTTEPQDEAYKLYPQKFDDREIRVAREGEAYGIHMLHTNFNSFPPFAKAVLARESLLPELSPYAHRVSLRQTPESVLPETMTYVLDRVLAHDVPARPDFARGIERYIGHSDKYRQHLLLGLLLTAAPPSAKANPPFSHRLAPALSAGSAFEFKAGQRIPGLPFVTPEFAEPFEKMTYAATKEPRWEILEWAETKKSAIEAVYQKQAALKGDQHGAETTIAKFGDVLGSGSLFVAIEVLLSDGSTIVVALRRPNVLEIAAENYRVAHATIEDIKDKRLFWQPLSEMGQAVFERLQLEANTLAAPAQYEKAAALYNLQVTVDDKAHTFETVRCLGAGDDFYLMSKAEGQHLIEAVNDESILEEERQALTEAVLTMEFYRLASGKFDYDRTGGQAKRNASGKLSLFDFKALPLEDWSAEGIEQFGYLVGKVLTSGVSAENFIEQFTVEENKLREAQTPIDPFVTEAKLLLITISRFIKDRYLSEQRVVRAALSGIAQGAHPALLRGAQRALGPQFGPVFQQFTETRDISILKALGMLPNGFNLVVPLSNNGSAES